MERILADPNKCLPVRRGPLQEYKLLLLVDAFTKGLQNELPPVNLVESEEGFLTIDGNHRLTLASYFENGQLPANLYRTRDLYRKPSGLLIPIESLVSELIECRRIAVSRGYVSYRDLCIETFGATTRSQASSA